MFHVEWKSRRAMGLSTTLCNRVLDLLTSRPKRLRIGSHASSGAPQGCVLNLPLYTLYTHDCTARHQENSIVKYADNTTMHNVSKTSEVKFQSRNIRNWNGLSTDQDRKALLWWLKLPRTSLVPIYSDIGEVRRLRRAHTRLMEHTYPSHGRFTLWPPEKNA